MKEFKIDKTVFKFKYLQDYASFLLNNKLEEYVTVGIRFCREVDLPMLRPLAKLSEKELITLSLDSNKEILSALVNDSIADFIEKNINRWISNNLGIIDRYEIVPEDLTLAFFLRRKIFSHFLDSYTKNVVLQKLIIAEVDVYTTQEELISLKAYIGIQKEKVD
ncbi:MAG: hypothetical protein ACXVPU_12810 [Bacteroidia bacterium]